MNLEFIVDFISSKKKDTKSQRLVEVGALLAVFWIVANQYDQSGSQGDSDIYGTGGRLSCMAVYDFKGCGSD